MSCKVRFSQLDFSPAWADEKINSNQEKAVDARLQLKILLIIVATAGSTLNEPYLFRVRIPVCPGIIRKSNNFMLLIDCAACGFAISIIRNSKKGVDALILS